VSDELPGLGPMLEELRESPTLSICIPTHSGRAAVLAELLETVADQARPGLEVCVSNNGGEDEIRVVLEEFGRRTGIPTVYSRNDTNVGVGRNIVRSVELAGGDYCWVMGSDDHLAPEALDTLFRLLVEHPGVTGISTRRDNFSPDMSRRLDPDRAAFYPEPLRTTRLSGTPEVLGNLGQAFAFLGVHVLHRERFLRAAREGLDDALAHPLWPQVYLFGLMVLRDPDWLWYPTPLVKARSYRSYIAETGEAGDNLGSVHAHVVTTLGRVWRDLMPPRSGPIYRALLRRALLVWAAPDQIGIIKRRPDQTLRTDARMLVAFTRRFWPLRDFWRDVFPRLLVPHPLLRAIDRVPGRWTTPSEPLASEAMRARVVAQTPAVVPVRSMLPVSARVTNTGDASFVSTPPHPVNLSYQWLSPDGEPVMEGTRAELSSPLVPGASATVTLRLMTPWEPGEYRLRITPVQEHVAWFGDVDPASALDLDVRAVPHDDV
jgi:glycosyltransferase involved in cell wall biosynthesis